MTDSIKFGPEWLRNMSQGISKPQLAEHRYGREEMLALFDISSCNLPPESLKEVSMVYGEKALTPLSLQQMSEEETRLWNRGINSDTIVRASVRTSGGRGTANIEVRGGNTSARGRGGRGGYYYNTTRPGYEEGPEGGGSSMNRGPHRPFERLNSSERNMNRNGEFSNDWRGRDESNWWRKNRGGAHQGQSEESNGRWGRTRTDSYNNDRWPAGRPTSRYDEDEGWDRGESRWSNNSSTHDRRKLDWGETLPEWAVDNPGEKGGSFDSSGAFHDNHHYDDDHHYNMRDEQSREKDQEYEESNDNDSSVNNLDNSNVLPTKDKQLNGQEKEEGVSSSISTSPSQNEEIISSPECFKSMRQQHQHNINTQTTEETVMQNEQVIVNHPEPVRIQQVPDIPVIHSKSSPTIPIMSDCQSNKMENIKDIREMSGIASHIDNSNINAIHRSTSLNANANHRIDTLDAEAESMVSRLTSDNFKIGPSSHTPSTLLANNKWYYRDPQGEVQGPFLTTEMAEWYSLGYFHDNMLMVKRACDEHFYSLGDLVRLKGNVPFSDTPFTEQDVKMSARIGVQPSPAHNPFTMNESLVLQQQHQHYQYRQLFLKQREIAIQNAVHQLSQSERWKTLSPVEQQQLIMHHIRNVEASTTMPPMFTAPILPQPQSQPSIHPINPPNNNLMVMLSHMQQQQQQQQQHQHQHQHFNHQIDPKHNIHTVSPQPMTQQIDPLHSLVQSMGGLKTSTSPPVNAPHHHQGSNIIRPSSVQPEKNPISDLLRQLGAPQDKPLKVSETSVWGMDFTSTDNKPKLNGPIGVSGWQTGPSIETSQQTPGILWGSGEYTKIIGADHQAIEEAIKEEARRSEEARKQELIKQNEQLRKRREEEKSKMQKELKKKQELEKAKLEEEKRKEEVRRNKEHEKKLKEEVEKKKIEKRKLEEEQAKRREHEKKIKEEKEKRLLEEKKKEEEKRLQEEEKKKKADLKKKEENKKKEDQKKKEDLKRKEEAKKQDQKKKDEEQKKKQDNAKSSAVPIVTEPQKKKKKETQTVTHNGVESASAPWAATDKKKQMQIKSMAEIQAEEQKREQMIKQKERERTEREISLVAIEQAKQEKARSAVKMQSWSTVITKNVPQSITANNSVWGSTNQMNHDKQQAPLKSNKTPVVVVNNKSNLKNNAVKTVNQTVQQTNAMKKAIESRGENNNCNDEFSQWCCKHLATLNKNTIDIPTFVTFLKDVESEYEVKDYIQNYLGDNKEVREFIKQFFDKRLKIQNKQRSSDFVEMKSKNKKRNKMVPLDNKVLGFNVVASERINVGELDLGE